MIPQNNKKHNIGFDFDGTASEGIFQEGGVIITGRQSDNIQEIKDLLGDVPIFPYPYNDLDEDTTYKKGMHKAKMVKSLGLESFYENEPEQVEIIKQENPDVNVVLVNYQKKLRYICFTFDGTILPIAYKLMKEGNEVIVGIIDDNKDILTKGEVHKPEDLEKKKDRMELYQGLLKVYPAKKVLKAMSKIKNKEDYFIVSDLNNTFKYTQLAEKMGFTGFLPNEQDRVFEVERSLSKDFVSEHYPDISIQEVQEFKNIEDGIKFLEETEQIWVLKSEGDNGDTIVPESEEPELAREQLIDSLQKQKKEYEQNGFILEEKIIDPIEITPEFMFWNGELIASTIDLENKPLGAGNQGSQTGCSQDLVFQFNEKDILHKIACPDKVREMAKERKGLFVWDISILMSGDKMYFGEFCSNRFGWDSFPTELSMCDRVSDFFELVAMGKNPFKRKFGAGVRLFNIDSNCKILEDGLIEWKPEIDKDLFIYEMKDLDGKFVSTSSTWDLAVATGSEDNLEDAVDKCYECVEKIAFDARYYRPKFDFLSLDYPTSIMNRYNFLLDNDLING